MAEKDLLRVFSKINSDLPSEKAINYVGGFFLLEVFLMH